MTQNSDHPIYKKLFRESLRIRLVEEAIIEHYPSDKIQSPVHLAIGQEFLSACICASLTEKDQLFTTYRSHGYYLAKGGSMNAMMAELYGRKTGCCQGKGGSMHLAAPEVGFVGTSAIVASSISNAVGLAFAMKQQQQEDIVVCVFGDGATEEGVYHESLNFACLHQLPILFVCENNGYAIHSKLEARQAYPIIEHAQSYGLTTAQVEDGHDLMAQYEVTSDIIHQVRTSRGPGYVLINTSRYKEHVGPGEDFQGGFREESEVSEWKLRDPLIQDEALYSHYYQVLKTEVDEAIAYAESSPFPTADDLLTDVY